MLPFVNLVHINIYKLTAKVSSAGTASQQRNYNARAKAACIPKQVPNCMWVCYVRLIVGWDTDVCVKKFDS